MNQHTREGTRSAWDPSPRVAVWGLGTQPGSRLAGGGKVPTHFLNLQTGTRERCLPEKSTAVWSPLARDVVTVMLPAWGLASDSGFCTFFFGPKPQTHTSILKQKLSGSHFCHCDTGFAVLLLKELGNTVTHTAKFHSWGAWDPPPALLKHLLPCPPQVPTPSGQG